MKKLAFIGAPLSGKGSLAKAFVKNDGLVHISTGDLFREAIAAGLPEGLEAKTYMERGDLVPDQLTIKILMQRLNRGDTTNGFILDGFPRTIVQAAALDEVIKLDRVIYFKIDDQGLIDRLLGRVVCVRCGAPFHLQNAKPQQEGICDHCHGQLMHRSDDNLASFKNRLELFKQQTAPVINYYRQAGLLLEVPAQEGVDYVYRFIKERDGCH